MLTLTVSGLLLRISPEPFTVEVPEESRSLIVSSKPLTEFAMFTVPLVALFTSRFETAVSRKLSVELVVSVPLPIPVADMRIKLVSVISGFDVLSSAIAPVVTNSKVSAPPGLIPPAIVILLAVAPPIVSLPESPPVFVRSIRSNSPSDNSNVSFDAGFAPSTISLLAVFGVIVTSWFSATMAPAKSISSAVIVAPPDVVFTAASVLIVNVAFSSKSVMAIAPEALMSS